MKNFIVTFAPLSSTVPPDVRLRQLLKYALRRHALRATDVREIEIDTRKETTK